MRIVTLEEHVSFPEMAGQIPKAALGGFGESERMQQLSGKLADSFCSFTNDSPNCGCR
jgi:hypothetical protein